MKYYCGNDKPFIYVSYPKEYEGNSIEVLQELENNGVTFWCPDVFSNSKKELRHIEASYGVLLFVSKNSYYSQDFRAIVDTAVKCNKNILTVYLEDIGKMDSWGNMQLNSAYSLMKYSFKDNDTFLKKIKEAAIFRDMSTTPEQKKFQKNRGITLVVAPIIAAIVLFSTIVYPLLIAPVVEEDDVFHIKGMTQEELDKITSLWIVGGTVYSDPNITRVHSWIDSSGKINVEIEYSDGRREYSTGAKVGDISDLSELSKLRNLRYLGVEGQNITDISPLYELKNLEYLGIECNPISSIEGISALTNLQQLFISCTDIGDITPLIGLKYLNNICADDTKIYDIPLEVFTSTSLNVLCLGGKNVRYLNNIEFPNDRSMILDIKNDYFVDPSCLTNITSYGRIDILSEYLSNIKQYIGSRYIDNLSTDLLGQQNLSFLSGLNINDLDINYCENLIDISDITSIQNLTEIRLENPTSLTNYSPLLKVESLKKVELPNSVREIAEKQLEDAEFEVQYF